MFNKNLLCIIITNLITVNFIHNVKQFLAEI